VYASVAPGLAEVTVYPADVTYRTGEWLDLLQTHSDHRGLPPGQLGALLERVGLEIDGHGGSFVMHYETDLITARRTEG
jgi:hypothetical protein